MHYHQQADCLLVVRIVQGLVHLGKDMIGLNPFFSDRSIMSLPAVAGLLARYAISKIVRLTFTYTMAIQYQLPALLYTSIRPSFSSHIFVCSAI